MLKMLALFLLLATLLCPTGIMYVPRAEDCEGPSPMLFGYTEALLTAVSYSSVDSKRGVNSFVRGTSHALWGPGPSNPA